MSCGNRRGMALAVTLMMMAAAGALITGVLFVAVQEQRLADHQRSYAQAFGTAEAGGAEVIRMWNSTQISYRGLIGTDSIAVADSVAPRGTGRYRGYIHKLNRSLYLIDVTGRDSRGLRPNRRIDVPARTRLGLLARVDPLRFTAKADTLAALTVGRLGVRVSGASSISGYDAVPPWPNCAASADSVAGVISSGLVNDGKKSNSVTGAPPAIQNDSSVTDSTFQVFGGATYAQLVQLAKIQLPAGIYNPAAVVTNGVCNVTVPTNWGDGTHTTPCGTYYPIVHIAGNATVTGNGTGQGVLLIDGDLNLGGSFQWFGIVIAQGTLKGAGGGNVAINVYGVAFIKGGVDESKVVGKIKFAYSKCALTQVLEGVSPVAILRSRAWTQLF